jgi:HK97 family phage prohead protease
LSLEVKFLSIAESGLALKSEDGEPVRIEGYASTFGGKPDSYGDTIVKGAFTKTIQDWGKRKYRLPMLLDHYSAPIGLWTELREDNRGLWAKGELTPGHTLACDVAASLKHGAVSGLSIGYRPIKYTMLDNGQRRQLDEIELGEISVVGRPANDAARVERVKAAECQTVRELEQWLRERGLSHWQAKLLCAGGFDALKQARDERQEGANGNDDPRDEGAAAGEFLEALRALRVA